MKKKLDISRYCKESLSADLKAGFITSIVALPLAIAFAIASGVPPVMGLYTAIIAGLLGSVLGGSRFSITGPTGAMTVIILATVSKYGFEGLVLAGLLAGVFQLAFGLFRLGRLVQYIPLPVVSGFTSGIGILILLGQVNNGLGMSVQAHEFIGTTLREIANNIGATQIAAVGIALGTVAMLYLLPKIFVRNKYLASIPASLVPLVLSVAATYFLRLAIPQVGDIPSGLPSFNLPSIDLHLIRQVAPSAFTIALLGSIEALLCAVVCDGMTGTKHDGDKELRGQGIANIVLPFLGGIPCTAAIARSAVNIREGARTRVAGVIHAIFILLYMVLLGPIVRYVPKAFLAGVLIFVSAKMINIDELKTVMRISRAETAVLVATALLTVLTDLVFAVEVGMVLAIFLVFYRFSKSVEIRARTDYDNTSEINAMLAADPLLHDNVSVYTIYGPVFFGAMNVFEKKINEHMQIMLPIMILRMTAVPFIDSTGTERLNSLLHDRKKQHSTVLLVLRNNVKQALLKDKEFQELMPKEHMFVDTEKAITYAKQLLQSKAH